MSSKNSPGLFSYNQPLRCLFANVVKNENKYIHNEMRRTNTALKISCEVVTSQNSKLRNSNSLQLWNYSSI